MFSALGRPDTVKYAVFGYPGAPDTVTYRGLGPPGAPDTVKSADPRRRARKSTSGYFQFAGNNPFVLLDSHGWEHRYPRRHHPHVGKSFTDLMFQNRAGCLSGSGRPCLSLAVSSGASGVRKRGLGVSPSQRNRCIALLPTPQKRKGAPNELVACLTTHFFKYGFVHKTMYLRARLTE